MSETLTPKERETVARCLLFKDMTPREMDAALTLLKAERRTFAKNEMIHEAGAPYRYAALVLHGAARSFYVTKQYDTVNLNNYETGDVVGLSVALFHPQYSPVELRASTATTLLLLDFAIPAPTRLEGMRLKLTKNVMDELARQNLFLNRRVMVLGQGSLRNRLLCFLASRRADEDGWVTVPFSRTALAEHLGANRSSLSREIGRMVDEGVLEADGRRFRPVK